MAPGSILKITIILTGVVMLVGTLISLSKKRMSESFSSAWVLASLAVILGGILTNPVRWREFISTAGLLLLMFVAFCVIYAAFYFSIRVSELMRRVNELAMQVALLNQELDVKEGSKDNIEQQKP